MKVSVVLSVYSEPLEWIRQSLDSIVSQSFRDFEFIIVNDKPDREDLRAYLDMFASNESRVRIIKNEENLGLTKSLNKALFVARGDYIARMDADDYSLPSRFEKQVEFLNSHPDVVMVGCYAKIMDERGKIIDERHTSTDYKYLLTMFPFQQPIYHPSMMFRRIIAGEQVFYNERMSVSQDYELCSRLINYPITNIPEFLLRYRISAKQMTKVYKDTYIVLDAPIRREALVKYYSGLDEKDADAFVNMYYLQKGDQKYINDIEIFIKHLYEGNMSNANIYLKPSMTYVLIRYVKFLLINCSYVEAIMRFIKLNNKLDNRLYLSLLCYVLIRIYNKIKIRLVG